MNNKEFFFCYDLVMADWIINTGGYPFITKAIHPKSGDTFFLFKQSDILSDLILKFQTMKKSIK